jgi:DNA damage-inducible protein 1
MLWSIILRVGFVPLFAQDKVTDLSVFGLVHLLYIDVEVNGYKFKALVDSGAQATIMSPACAEACGIMRLVDKRFAGVARGVGTANIIGRVHSAQIKIGELFLPCSFTVMEGKQVELLLGLDMLKRHQACIDLAKDKLIIQGVEISFLGEADIPKESAEAYQSEPRVPGPAGTTIGARSGAVTAPSEPAPSSGGPTPGPTTSAPPARTFPRDHIDQLKALGASEEKAIQALEATGGDVEYAASLIFND